MTKNVYPQTFIHNGGVLMYGDPTTPSANSENEVDIPLQGKRSNRNLIQDVEKQHKGKQKSLERRQRERSNMHDRHKNQAKSTNCGRMLLNAALSF